MVIGETFETMMTEAEEGSFSSGEEGGTENQEKKKRNLGKLTDMIHGFDYFLYKCDAMDYFSGP